MRILWNLFHGENKENFVNADTGMRNWDKALTEFILQCNSHNISDYDIYDRNRPAAIEKLKGFYFKVLRNMYHLLMMSSRMVLYRLVLIVTP